MKIFNRKFVIHFYKIRLEILDLINRILIKFFVKYEFFNLLSYLFILNLTKLKKILPNKNFKYKAIVLYRTGGIDDLFQSQKKYNKNILYLSFPRFFFKQIMMCIYKKKNFDFNDFKYSYDNDKLSVSNKKKYKDFLVTFLKVLKKKYNFNILISFSFLYSAEKELHAACSQLKIPFLILYKESIHTEIQKKYFLYTYKKINENFEGYKIAVYSKYAKKLLIESNIANNQKIDVVGCSRLNESFSYKKFKPKNQILYYAIQDDRGLPTALINTFGKKFFKDIKNDLSFNTKYNWNKLHIKTLKALKIFAKNNPKILIIIKIKHGETSNKKEYFNLPKNIKIIDHGAGHTLLKESKIVIGYNTTSVLEAIAANRFILIPYFHKKNKFLKHAELKLGLNKSCYVNLENDFINMLSSLIKKDYKKDKIYNNLNALDYHLGNSDSKADLRLNKFLKKNLFWN